MNRNDVINHVLGNMYSGREESGGYSYSRPSSQSGGFSVPTASSVGGVGAQSYGGGAGGGGFFPFVPLGGSGEFPEIPEDQYDYAGEYATEPEPQLGFSEATEKIREAFGEATQKAPSPAGETEVKAPRTLETPVRKPWENPVYESSVKSPIESNAPVTNRDILKDTQKTLESEKAEQPIRQKLTTQESRLDEIAKSPKEQTVTNREILKNTQAKLEAERAKQEAQRQKLSAQENRLDEIKEPSPQYSGSFGRQTSQTQVASTGVDFSGDKYLYHGRDIQGVGTSGATFEKPSLLRQGLNQVTEYMREKNENPLPELASWGLALPALAVGATVGAGTSGLAKTATAIGAGLAGASQALPSVAEPTKPKKSGTSAKAVTATTPKASTPAPVKISAPAVASTPKATTTAKPTFTDAISQIKSAFSSAISSATPKASTTTQKLTTQEKRLGKL